MFSSLINDEREQSAKPRVDKERQKIKRIHPLPPPHTWHWLAVDPEKEPAAQGVQMAALSLLYVPGIHDKRPAAPVGQYEPAVLLVQAVSPGAA